MTAPPPSPELDVLLAVTDFSDGARLAVDRAALLAHQHHAELHLAHAVRLPTVVPAWGDPGGGAWVDTRAITEAAQQQLEHEALRIEEAHGDRPRVHVTTGATHRGLGELAAQLSADLVVVGARGAGFRLGRLLGSTAERLIRSLAAPVLVVRTPARGEYERVAIATDFSGPALAAASVAGRLAPAAERLLVHVHEDLYRQLGHYAGVSEADVSRHERHAAAEATRALEAEVARLEAEGLHVSGVLRDGQATEVLPRLVVECATDLLALGTHGQAGLERLLLGSVSAWMLGRVDCDVLVARG